MVTAADDRDTRARAHAHSARAVVCSLMPYLAGVAQALHVEPCVRVDTAGVTASGRLLLNPGWFLALDLADAAFVFAHEALHLVYGHHARFERADPRLANIATDAVINAELSQVFGRVPSNGIWFPWLPDLSSEQLLRLLEDGEEEHACWTGSFAGGQPAAAASPLADALARAGLVLGPPSADVGWDLIGASAELRLVGPLPASAHLAERVDSARREAIGLKAAYARLTGGGLGAGDGGPRETCAALAALHRPPWELALQRHLSDLTPSGRTYARPSRRGAARDDVVRPGRDRQGWILNVILDTSGSMHRVLPTVLGQLAAFARAAGVGAIRVVQCDDDVTVDEEIEPEALALYGVAGGGGSDVNPAFARLADDPFVTHALVLTDGDIWFPMDPPPFEVLWAIVSGGPRRMPYGRVVAIEVGA